MVNGLTEWLGKALIAMREVPPSIRTLISLVALGLFLIFVPLVCAILMPNISATYKFYILIVATIAIFLICVLALKAHIELNKPPSKEKFDALVKENEKLKDRIKEPISRAKMEGAPNLKIDEIETNNLSSELKKVLKREQDQGEGADNKVKILGSDIDELFREVRFVIFSPEIKHTSFEFVLIDPDFEHIDDANPHYKRNAKQSLGRIYDLMEYQELADRKITIKPPRTYKHYPNIWGVVVNDKELFIGFHEWMQSGHRRETLRGAHRHLLHIKKGNPHWVRFYELFNTLFIHSGCLFRWERVPGVDSRRLKNYLKQDLKIGWAKYVKNTGIKKSKDDKTIKVTYRKNSLKFKLNKRQNKAILEISARKTYEYLLREENDELRIYKKQVPDTHE